MELAEGHPFIDRLYELLEGVEGEERELRYLTRNPSSEEVFRFPALSEAVQFLQEFGFGGRLGLSDIDRGKFDRQRGAVDTTVLLRLSGRVRTLLREAEGEVAEFVRTTTPATSREAAEPEQTTAVVAVEWVPRPKSGSQLVSEIADLLDEIIPLARSTNLPPDEAAITQLQRAQLITLLETTLALIKAPLVEKGLLKKVADAAQSGAAAAVQKQSEFALGFALKKLGDALLKFLGLM